MDKSTVVERVKQYASVVVREFPVSMVVLFGSYASDKFHTDSDIDVAVIVNELTGDYLTLAARLCTLRNDIDPMIEPHLMTTQGHDGGFLSEILRTGEVIYKAA